MTMQSHLLVTVRFHEGRYHGAGDWPPSPARLFQAFVAGAGLKGPLTLEEVAAFEWLEVQQYPIMASPPVRRGQAFVSFVPNNDLDAVGGNPRNIGAIRAKKQIRPRLFDDATTPLLYAWPISQSPDCLDHAQAICQIASRLYQLGRGVDLAWAWGELIDAEELDLRLADFPGEIHRPCASGTGLTSSCPTKGSLRSLAERYASGSKRFETVVEGRSKSQNFRRQPKAWFQPVHYNSPPDRKAFEIRAADDLGAWRVWPLAKACAFIESVRDAAFAKLAQAFPEKEDAISRLLIGRRPDGSNGGSPADRIRLIPLPSIGVDHADHQIRRVLLEIPPTCPLRSDDLVWAFNGLELGEGGGMGQLVPTAIGKFSDYYGIQRESFGWSTLTPVALPEAAKRRRVDPGRKASEAKNASERAIEQHAARTAICAALRHAGISSTVCEIVVQREPFQSRGLKSDFFAAGTRFQKERLWHVRLRFQDRLNGPLVLGDGRFLGLGVFKVEEVFTPSPPEAHCDESSIPSTEEADT